jgi:hypothetical protein
VNDASTPYFQDHGLGAGRNEMNILEIESFISPKMGSQLLDPAGKHLSLSRFGVAKYLAHGALKALAIYTSFQIYGRLKLIPSQPSETCKTVLSMEITAYQWSPLLVVEGNGVRWRSEALEQGYLDGISTRLP